MTPKTIGSNTLPTTSAEVRAAAWVPDIAQFNTWRTLAIRGCIGTGPTSFRARSSGHASGLERRVGRGPNRTVRIEFVGNGHALESHAGLGDLL